MKDENMKGEDMKGEDMKDEEMKDEETKDEEMKDEETKDEEIKEKERMPTNRKISAILIITGAALLLVACGLFTYNRVFDYRAGLRAQELLDQVLADADWDLPPIEEMVYIPHQQVAAEPDKPKSSPPPLDVSTGGERPPLDIESGTYGGSYISYGNTGSGTPAAPTYTTLGILTIPKLNVRLPVIAEYTDANLKISCCRISGRAENKPYRLVISGHNIWSHFKGLDTLQLGDQIAFTDRDGITYYYEATEFLDLYKTNGAAVLEAVGWDITLITCKTDNTWRTVVRFTEITE